jgi:phenylacetate-coenzyme A ligase PaaK-like adenylate-forming protein
MLNNVKALHQVMRDAKLTKLQVDNLVSKRLRNVLISAYRHVPYYRESMQKAGFNPERNYQGPQDIQFLPIVTKKTFKQMGKNSFIRKGSNTSDCHIDSTSGSTGIPLTVYRTPYERSIQIAKWLRVLFHNGYSIHHKVMSLSSPARLTEGQNIVQKFGLLRRQPVNYLLPPQEMVDQLFEYGPDVLYGNRSHLDLMAVELEQRGMTYNGLRILAGTAEVITEHNRSLYRRAFNIELTETYGSVEMGIMAYQLPNQKNLHLCNDLTLFEFLDNYDQPVPPNTPGRVVVTDLFGKFMPFIRYDQGDLAAYTLAEDGTKKITRIIGRDDDYAVLPDGSRRPFHDFYEIMDKYDNIMQFSIIQRTRSRFEVLIVADETYLSSIHDALLHNLQQKFPPTVTFEIMKVDQIQADPNGKTRMLISEVD